jgi:hypothetical protein
MLFIISAVSYWAMLLGVEKFLMEAVIFLVSHFFIPFSGKGRYKKVSIFRKSLSICISLILPLFVTLL